MTDQNNAAQAVLTDEQIRDIITGTHHAFGEFKSGYMLVLGRAIEQAVLSKLRAPVADERDRNATISEVVGLCDRIPGATTWNAAEFMYDEMHRRAALASAPVADERVPHHDQPQQTGVGEWCAPGPAAEQRRVWLLRFADTERGDCIYYDEQEARRSFAQAEGRGWNCYLFEFARRAPVAGEAKSPDRAMLEAVMNDLNVSDWNCPRCGHAEECSTMDAALMLRDYLAAPQASEAVCKEDVATVLHFIFEHFGKPFNACDLPGYVVAAVRRLEHAALSAQPDAEPLSNPKQFALTGTDERTAFEATYQADYDDPGAACEREHFGKGYRAGLAAQSGAQRTGGSNAG